MGDGRRKRISTSVRDGTSRRSIDGMILNWQPTPRGCGVFDARTKGGTIIICQRRLSSQIARRDRKCGEFRHRRFAATVASTTPPRPIHMAWPCLYMPMLASRTADPKGSRHLTISTRQYRLPTEYNLDPTRLSCHSNPIDSAVRNLLSVTTSLHQALIQTWAVPIWKSLATSNFHICQTMPLETESQC